MTKSENQKFHRWYSKPENKKRMKEHMKKYYKKNQDKLLIYSKEFRAKKNYNKPLKNIVRNKVIGFVYQYKCNSILTLESYKYLFSKYLPEKKIIVYENHKESYNLMSKHKPENVKLIYGDISEYGSLNGRVDCVYLDFCTNWTGAKAEIYKLKEVINHAKLFAITLNLRDNIDKLGEIQFSYINAIQEIFNNLKIVYGQSYNDSSPTITLIFEVIK